jgi:hypothetical protein
MAHNLRGWRINVKGLIVKNVTGSSQFMAHKLSVIDVLMLRV